MKEYEYLQPVSLKQLLHTIINKNITVKQYIRIFNFMPTVRIAA